MSNKNKQKQDKEPNRSYGKIKTLPPEIREMVDTMIIEQKFKYREIVEFIWDNAEVKVDQTMVSKYAKRLNKSLKEIHMTQENLRFIIAETAKYPDLDATDCVVRLLTSRVIEAVQNIPEENWRDLNPIEVMDKWSRLMKVISYKKDIDVKVKNIRDVGFDSVKDEVFNNFAEERPQLYKDFMAFLNEKQAEGQE